MFQLATGDCSLCNRTAEADFKCIKVGAEKIMPPNLYTRRSICFGLPKKTCFQPAALRNSKGQALSFFPRLLDFSSFCFIESLQQHISILSAHLLVY